MNKQHLDDFLQINEENPNIKVGDLIREYTGLAVNFAGSHDDLYRTTDKDYELSHKVMMEKYKTK